MSSITRENFLDLVLAFVHERFPLVNVDKDTEGYGLVLDGNPASMENLYRVAIADPESLQHNMERWITELVRAGEGIPLDREDFTDVKDRIMPMVLAEAVPDVGSPQVLREGIVPGLDLAYAIDCERTIAYIPPASLERWGITMDQLHETALDNLATRSEDIAAHAAEDENGQINIVCLQTMDGYDASRILLPNLHERLRKHLGSPFIAGIPNRDILVCFRNMPEVVEPMHKQIGEGFRTMPHQISDQLFLITADGIAPFEPPQAEPEPESET